MNAPVYRQIDWNQTNDDNNSAIRRLLPPVAAQVFQAVKEENCLIQSGSSSARIGRAIP